MTFQQWLTQGESLYQNAVKEYQALEAQLADAEARLAAKQAEVNQIAAVLGKSAVEPGRRRAEPPLPAPLLTQVEDDVVERVPVSVTLSPSPSNTHIARALTGRFGR